MDSKKPTSQNSSFENIKVKVEPGTSNVTPPSSTTRLTSFRLPRDLTLGGAIKTEKSTKKIYTPNINVQRNKKKDDGSAAKPENTQKTSGRGRGRGATDRGRGRGKAAINLIQSTGVFSEGMSGPGRSTRRSSGIRNGTGEREPSMVLERSKLNLDYEFDKAEEEKKLKLLLRDDFIDDGEDFNLESAPVILPLTEQAKLYKEECKEKIKESVSEEEEEEEEVDQKPIILENGQAVMPPKKMKKKKKAAALTGIKEEKSERNVSHIINNQSNSYFLVAFPDCLPGVHSVDTDTDPRIKKNKEQPPENNDAMNPEYCTLHTLKDGFLGKIQIHQSGKAILRLGENSLVIDVGSRQSFRQDLIAAKVDASNSELVNLGQVTSTLICSPDWESMLANL
ncbi:DNA-directed RNA polymerase III subunit RPC4 [Diachasma alloeum]|uniref:DNA-directed RNA polymerase III subunit RPC4 n=1 Tax=Diachasma alloeum TaxID=454923 RepID=UPI00073850CC|nr:DNA-directed RNA polymerase III subunit RPC4 [Diachasma alloeum]